MNLKNEAVPIRISFKWLGLQRRLREEQNRQAADTFSADDDYLRTSKKLLDTTHPAWRACTKIKSRIRQYWKGVTMPFPEDGVRLLRKAEIEPFVTRMTNYREELFKAVDQLDSNYQELKDQAKAKLGDLYEEKDYPEHLRELFDVAWDWPSVEPPDYLKEMHPDLYAQEEKRIQAQFDEARRLTEQALATELKKLVEHLAQKLSPSAEGSHRLHSSSIDNVRDFFNKFRDLNVTSNQALNELVEKANQLVDGVPLDSLRNSAHPLHTAVQEGMAKISEELSRNVITMPRRRIAGVS